MKIARKYQAQTPVHSIRDADIIPIGYASRLWKKFIPGGIFNGTPEKFIGGGWKELPQELVDEVLGYLLDDLDALKACSLTCKFLFNATRLLIHQRLVCLGSMRVHPKPNGSRKRVPGVFERLIDADRSGVLPHTRHLTFKPNYTSPYQFFYPGHLQEYLPYLRSIIKLRTLTLDTFHISPFIPVFNEHFGMFANTLRHLDIQRAHATAQELSYIICQFPLLEDLTIAYPGGQDDAHARDEIPVITQSPPLRGKLALIEAGSMELSEGLAAFPGGLKFRSLESSWPHHLRPIFAACSHTATSVSYLWPRGVIYGEQSPYLDAYRGVTSGTIAAPLDLKQNVVLERFEFDISSTSTSTLDGWICLTLRTITSPAFKEFMVWLPNEGISWDRMPMNSDRWGVVDASLVLLSERNPDFRIVLRGDSPSSRYGTWRKYNGAPSFAVSYLPLVSSKGLVKFERVPHSENRFGKPGAL